MNSIVDIVQKLWRPAKQLQATGILPDDYLTELTWLLVLKLAPLLGFELPKQWNWQGLIHKTGQAQFHHYQTLLALLAKHDNPMISVIYQEAKTHFTQPAHLTEVITTLNAVNHLDIDEIGEIYERLLENCAKITYSKSYTVPPRVLLEEIVILTQPQLGEIICDPAMSSGRFLVATHDYLKVMNDDLYGLSAEKRHFQQRQAFIGLESDLIQRRLALTNCLFHQIMPIHNLPASMLVDVVFSQLCLPNQIDRAVKLLKQSYQLLKPNGRAAVIVSDELLQTPDLYHELLETCHVHTILRLPHDIFYPQAMSAQVLFFRQSSHSASSGNGTWVYDLRRHSPQLSQLTREELLPFETVYGDDPTGQSHRVADHACWQWVTRQTLLEHQDRLDDNGLQENTKPLQKNPHDILTVLDTTVEELENLRALLGEEKPEDLPKQ